MGVEPCLHAVLHIHIEGVGGQGDDGDLSGILPVQGADGSGGFQSVHLRHPHIHQDGRVIARRVLLEQIHGFPAVDCQVRGHLPRLQEHHQDLRVDGDVLCHKDMFAGEICLFCAMMQIHSFSSDGRSEFIHDRCGEEGLGQEAVHARAHSFILDVIPAIGCQNDDGCLGPHDLADLSGGLHAVHPGHLPIYQDQVVIFPPGMTEADHLHRFLTGGRGLRCDPGILQHQSCVFARHRIIVDDKDAHFIRMDLAVLLVSVLSLGIRQRYCYGEDRSLVFLALHLDAAIHQFHDAFGDGESQAGTAVLVGG